MIRITKAPAISLWKRFLATHTATTPPTAVAAPPTRHDWTKEEVQRIYDTPLLDLVFRSASVHRQYHDPTKVQLCTLMNIKSKWYC
jgi:biotin synthase